MSAVMPIHKLKLLEKRPVADNTVEFRFSKPEGFQFIPGQYGGFTLIEPPETDAGGNTRRFSLLSTPEDDYLAITTRIQQSAYKRVLNALPKEAEIKFAGPSGNFTLHEDSNIPAVFIAGGIGIAPFYSIITHAMRVTPRNITLFYGNQSQKDTAYLDELTTFSNQSDKFKLIAAMVQPQAGWQGETGYITHTMLKKYLPDLTNTIYYVCGSPAMVTALQETLLEMDIKEEHIKVEDFPGY
jgi:ferredoxin-NADP reductase